MRDGTGTATYAYDAASRTTGKTDPGALAQGCAYDGDGLKRSETSGSGRTTLIWDGGDYLQSTGEHLVHQRNSAVLAYPDTGNVLLHLGWWDWFNDSSVLIRTDDFTLNMEDAEEGWSFGLALVGALGGEGDLEANHHWYNGSWMGVEYRLTFRCESNDGAIEPHNSSPS